MWTSTASIILQKKYSFDINDTAKVITFFLRRSLLFRTWIYFSNGFIFSCPDYEALKTCHSMSHRHSFVHSSVVSVALFLPSSTTWMINESIPSFHSHYDEEEQPVSLRVAKNHFKSMVVRRELAILILQALI